MTLKLRPLASNMTELELGDKTILFSYRTPVACHIAGEGYYRTDKHWSPTTSRHINIWLKNMMGAREWTTKDQSFFDEMVQP
jgi:hypothetical protein